MLITASFKLPRKHARGFRTGSGSFVIGRAEDADLHLDHPEISRTHALLTVLENGSGFSVEDCRSANGTFIDGLPVDGKATLDPHQMLSVGPYHFSLSIASDTATDTSGFAPEESGDPQYEEIIRQAVQSLSGVNTGINRRGENTDGQSDDATLVRNHLFKAILELLPDGSESSLAEKLVEKAIMLSLGLGPIEEWLGDQGISEIMINGTEKCYLEKNGSVSSMPPPYPDNASLYRIIDRILMPLGRRVDESSPYVDGRLPDGSRVNVIIPPLSLTGPVITIRKFPDERLLMEDMVRQGAFSEGVCHFLDKAVRAKRNILVSGGTGTGKTTLLNALAAFIPEGERIITIEDAAELRLYQDHVIRLETRPPNLEGKGEVTTRDLVRNALRMRPDRILVGECRGQEALDMLQAMNTGHQGSMTTCHANSPRDALRRIETMALMAGLELPHDIVREQVASAIHIIIQLQRTRVGDRVICQIDEVSGMESKNILLQPIFSRKGGGEALLPSGLRAHFLNVVDDEG